MMRQEEVDFSNAVVQFLDGTDRSAQHVGAIEGIVIEYFQEQDWFDDVSYALAMFVPNGGDHYFNEHELARVLRSVLPLLGGATEDSE